MSEGGIPFRLIRSRRWVGRVVAGNCSGPYRHVEHHTDLPAPELDSLSSSPSSSSQALQATHASSLRHGDAFPYKPQDSSG